MDAIILLLFITSLASQQVLCQEGNKVTEEGDGHQRNIYSQKHLSPHRMMHFGKRPLSVAPPTIPAPQVFDPYLLEQQLVQRQQRSVGYLQPENPFLFSIELEQGRRIQELPEGPFEMVQQQQQPIRDSSSYSLENRLPQAELFGLYDLAEHQTKRQAAANQALGRQKLMKLMQSNEPDSETSAGFTNNLIGGGGGSSSGERAQSSENGQQDDNGRQQPAININTRSVQASRQNTLSLPKAYLSSYLYGRQGSPSIPSYTGFNKKAEPKENFFMHFGRK